MTTTHTPTAQSPLALLPLMLYLLLFVGAGVYFQSQGVDFAFYKLSPVVAILPAIIVAILLSKQRLNDAIETFMQGIGDHNIIAMCLIYLLAGAFAAVAKATGGVDATVALGLTLIPASLLLPGLFLISAFIATAMGTSMGTIAAVAPVAFGIAQQAGFDPALMAGVVLSGAIFGDNLSIISDTTIAATRTQGAQMKDKFRENLRVALPAAVITMGLLALNSGTSVQLEPQQIELTKVFPYLAILVLAVAGVNVFLVLTIGVLLAGLTALLAGNYDLMRFGQDIYQGFSNMQEIFLLSMLVGGLAALMKQQGGIAWLTQHIAKWIGSSRNEKAAELGMGALVAATNVCVANNTVSLIVVGPIAKQLAREHGVTPRRAAASLDVFSCIVQGLIPYGAQALLLASTFSLSPLSVVAHGWYCFILALVGIATVLWRRR
ncbi:Na+/H+ antiporter NhaC family protein [uncultured Ferrimonas sp.]|uniref:Na+/H+ antiporter NhaC family protein n=1 Tax=uncultured Ferrimonas sp. TaxID=432640 RepID=UPI002601D32D|nr:Na+/H+ antiporter NhaC family protein [uncultured Ferrimonas sp.]